MITQIAQVSLLVRDYDDALAFYCGRLKFVCAEDTVLSASKRWIRIRPSASSGSEILLVLAGTDEEKSLVGRQTAGRVLFFFHTNDFEQDFKDLQAAGVNFVEGPFDRPHGKVAVFQDLYGNRMDLIEPRSN